ncbi:MAG: hypothetical protein Q8K55_14240 [Gemmatimonadaceae bacterium]|nr:hypothetical protein [Gemmatimonadaceae bacterium]
MPVEVGWRASWRGHPRVMRLLLWTFVGALAASAALAWRTAEYRREVRALRAGMSGNEKVRADLALASDAKRLQVMMALAVRQARTAGDLHVSVAVDSGVLHLEQRGAILRTARVEVGADGWLAAAGDSVPMASPRGLRRVLELRGDSVVVLTGGTTLYRGDTTAPVRAGSVRVGAADLRSILPNLRAGLPVYFY